jgi:hypothetical protein
VDEAGRHVGLLSMMSRRYTHKEKQSIMATTTKISITACDNELYILAASVTGGPTTEICHIMSGYSEPVNYSISPGAVLKPGTYNLFIIGINWGGPARYKITLTTGGVTQKPITYSNSSPPGVWTPKNVPQITVSPPARQPGV